MVGVPSAYTVVDFLKEVGVARDPGKTVSSVDSAEIINWLLQTGLLDQATLRAATQLRYLICQRKLTTTAAQDLFEQFERSKN